MDPPTWGKAALPLLYFIIRFAELAFPQSWLDLATFFVCIGSNMSVASRGSYESQRRSCRGAMCGCTRALAYHPDDNTSSQRTRYSAAHLPDNGYGDAKAGSKLPPTWDVEAFGWGLRWSPARSMQVAAGLVSCYTAKRLRGVH